MVVAGSIPTRPTIKSRNYRLPQNDWDIHQPQQRNSTIGTNLLLSLRWPYKIVVTTFKGS